MNQDNMLTMTDQNTNDAISFNIIFPNGDEINCTAYSNEILSDCINRSLHDACKQTKPQSKSHDAIISEYRQTCIVQIENVNNIHAPTSQEIADLRASYSTEDGYRYAHTYLITSDINNASVFLNLLRIYYTDKHGDENVLYAYRDEGMLSLRERNCSIIDRAFACGGSLSCSSCHIFVGDEFFNTLDTSFPISVQEEDLLDCVSGVTKLSRLGCTISFNNTCDNIKLFHPQNKKILNLTA